MSFYAECKEDLFAIDSNNQIRVCREDDIVCSPLASIVAEKGEGFTCELFDLHLSHRNCWNGQISAKTRGKAPKKVTINPKKPSTSSGKATKSEPWLSDSTKTYLILVVILIMVLLYQHFSKKYRLYKRQIRNMWCLASCWWCIIYCLLNSSLVISDPFLEKLVDIANVPRVRWA